MYKSFLEAYVVHEEDTVIEAYWKYSRHHKILIVVDKHDNFSGVLTHNEINNWRKVYNKDETIHNLINKNCKTVQYTEDQNLLYGNVRNVFADNLKINAIPILQGKNIVDLFTRERAFWLSYYESKELPYYSYAEGVYEAAKAAKQMNYDSISVIEFGVAGGNGLKMLESHAKEISRIMDINIEVYGFDSGNGLPCYEEDYRNLPNIWPSGSYKIDLNKLQSKLTCSKLIIGDIEHELKTFIKNNNPSPIGFVSVDVDFYSPTVHILDFLSNVDDKYCLPRINIYFDDILNSYEFQGEALAIKEFNTNNKDYKISPENAIEKLKIFHNFKHKLYNYNNSALYELPLQAGSYL